MSDQDRELGRDDASDVLERAIRTIAIAIALAGALIALAIYWRPSPPRYQVVTMGDQVVRLNTHSGTMVACNVRECGYVIRESRGIGENRGYALLPPQAAPATQPAPRAVPAPTPAPAPSSAPTPPAARKAP
jgi:hypothetical protein